MANILGFRDLVVHHGKNFNTISSLPPRMISLPPNLVDQEERIRAYWMIEILDSSSTIGASWNFGLFQQNGSDLVPCSDELWSLKDYDTMDLLDPSTSFATYANFIAGHIWHVHAFVQEIFDPQSPESQQKWQERCYSLDTRLTERSLEVQKHVQEGASPASMIHTGSYMTMIRCTANSAIIAIYQRVTTSDGRGKDTQPWGHAVQRCLDVSRDTSDALRVIPDHQLEGADPMLISHIFIAARFLLAYASYIGTTTPPYISLLTYAIDLLSNRWHIAKQLGMILRTAMVEYSLPEEKRSVPLQFYNLQYSAVDIQEALRVWALSRETARL